MPHGKIKKSCINIKIAQTFPTTTPKGRGLPIYLHDKVKNKFEKLLDEKHIAKLTNCPNKFFISPIVVTVKNDQSIKLALKNF